IYAQNIQSGYFENYYMYRYQANPAFDNEGKGFVAMPGLGNLNVTTNGTIGLNHIFYNVNGETTTLLNPSLSADKVLNGMKEHSRLGVDLRETILAVGFRAFKGYNTITIGARSTASVGLPKEIVRLAKEGLTNTTYDLSNLGASGRAWAEVAFQHSHRINKQLQVGGAVKFLAGVGSVDAHVKTANLHLYEDHYVGEVDAELNGSIKGLRYENSYNDKTNRHYVDGIKVDDFNPYNGFGLAFDLGAVYNFDQDWEFSLAFTDLGFISWSENMLATTDGLQSADSDTFAFNVDNNDSWDKFVDNLSYLYQLEDKGNTGGRTTGIGATMSAGAQYTLPYYRRLKFGLLNTTRINGDFSWTEFRLSANVEPVNCFSAGVNVGMGTFGASFGWILNFKTTGFNLFLASDHTPGKLAKQYAPLNSNVNVNFGINFPF
ncbi:MAG: hypothetical protein K2G40_09950, partial [Muribaculaceae bacterium]|nr:hypothetical protein [Muribaculaceae bacterium]